MGVVYSMRGSIRQDSTVLLERWRLPCDGRHRTSDDDLLHDDRVQEPRALVASTVVADAHGDQIANVDVMHLDEVLGDALGRVLLNVCGYEWSYEWLGLVMICTHTHTLVPRDSIGTIGDDRDVLGHHAACDRVHLRIERAAEQLHLNVAIDKVSALPSSQ